MIARVVPLLRLPRSIGVFDYRAGDPCPQPGMLVAVPFRKRTVPAVVLETTTNTNVPAARLLRIIRTITDVPLIDRARLQLMITVARETFSSPATVARSFIPHMSVTKVLALPAVTSEPMGTRNAVSSLSSVIGSTEVASIVTYRTDTTKRSFIDSARRAAADAGLSTLIIAPTTAHVHSLEQGLDNALTYMHDLPDVARRNAFLTIRTAKAVTVIGTRSAILAPLTELGLIIIDDEDHDGHVQEAPNPRFDARRVALMLARSTGCRIIFLSRLPSLVTAASYPIAASLDSSRTVKRTFVDLDASRAAGDYNIISGQALALVKRAAADGGNALIVHARRSDFGSLECRECGYVVCCPVCNVPMPQEGLRLTCKHCASSLEVPARCPRCSSVDLKGRGRGMSHVQKELAEAAGLQANVIEATDAPRARSSEVDIVSMAQAAALHDGRTYRAVVITRYDSAFSVPRFDAEERARRLLISLESHTASDGTIVVQSSAPFKPIVMDPYDGSWRDRARAATERFGYPPAWKLVLLRIRKGAASRTSPAQLYSTIRRVVPDAVVSEPQQSIGRSRKDRGGVMLLVRVRKTIPSGLERVLSQLDEHWTITVNPTELR